MSLLDWIPGPLWRAWRFLSSWRLVRRAIRHWWQRRTRGWDDSDTWSLDAIVADFMLPRLRRLRKITIAHPHGLTPEQWDEVLGEIDWFLEQHSSARCGDMVDDGERYKKAGALFGEYFGALWW